MRKYIFTPVMKSSGVRAEMNLSHDDMMKIQRGCHWKAIVTDLETEIKYKVWQKSCGLPHCLCDAYAEEAPE